MSRNDIGDIDVVLEYIKIREYVETRCDFILRDLIFFAFIDNYVNKKKFYLNQQNGPTKFIIIQAEVIRSHQNTVLNKPFCWFI